jgi:hypothetical protein
MKDRENNQSHLVQLPPPWCGSICRNAMSEVCMEHCAIERDCSGFEPKPNLNLGDMPRFPLKASSNMTKDEKFTAVTVYLAKVVDHLKGIEDEPQHLIFPRALPAVSIEERKAIAEVVAGFQASQNHTANVETDTHAHQSTESNSNPLVGPEIVTRKENE